MIPTKLHNKELRFIKIRSKSKVAVEKSWNTTANYKWDDKAIVDWLKAGQNYGLVCGYGGLIAVDADTAPIVAIVESALPKTFTVRTGKDVGKHYIYHCTDWSHNTALDIDGANVGHIKAANGYIVGAGSIHPSGKVYTVEKNQPIAVITVEQLKLAFKGLFVEHEKSLEQSSSHCNYDITEVVDMSKLHEHTNGEWQGVHPVHGSTGGNNFTVNPHKNSWYCFRHNVGGTTLQLCGVLWGITQCKDMHCGLSDKDYSEVLRLWHKYKEAKK